MGYKRVRKAYFIYYSIQIIKIIIKKEDEQKMIGSIKGNVIEIVKIANEICEERGLNIKDMLDTNDPNINTIFNEAVEKFEKENEQEQEECHRCKKHRENIKALEREIERRKAEQENMPYITLSQATIVGLEMALTIME